MSTPDLQTNQFYVGSSQGNLKAALGRAHKLGGLGGTQDSVGSQRVRRPSASVFSECAQPTVGKDGGPGQVKFEIDNLRSSDRLAALAAGAKLVNQWASARPSTTIPVAVVPYYSPAPTTRLSGPIQFLKGLLAVWDLPENWVCKLLGLDPDDTVLGKSLMDGTTPLRGRDARDRIVCLIGMRAILQSVFRDENVEREWLHERQEVFEGRSPLDLVEEGSMENLLRVYRIVEEAGGLR
jgi:hypothetical protein